MGLGTTTFLLVAGMLITGSINTVSKKAGYNTCSVGLPEIDVQADTSDWPCPEGQRKFKKPWSQTLVMFVGESMCFFIFLFKKRQRSRNSGINDRLLLDTAAGGAKEPNYSPTWSSLAVCAIPAFCDLGGTTVSGIGLLFTTSSLYQMLRGSIIIFTGLFSVFFLGRKLMAFHWLGIGITTAGVALVGVSSLLGDQSSSTTDNSQQMIGNVLVIASQLLSATQMVVEEKFLKSRNLPPEFVVATEGVTGALLMLAIGLPVVSVLPGLDGAGVHENALDAVVLISNSGMLALFVFLYFFSITFYNYFGLSVAKKLSSVHRCLIDACRTILVWSAGLILEYTVGHGYGEPWNGTSSIIQLCGFLIMVIGTLIYYSILKLPCCSYEVDDVDEQEPLIYVVDDDDDHM